ncbi:MAG: RNA polymerase sigma factor [Chloroflexota bacterium]
MSSSASSRKTPSNQQTEQLVQLYYPYIVRLIHSIIHDIAEAEDLAQETFIAALLNLDSEPQSINYKSWLSKIAVNKARDLLRRRSVRNRWQSLFTHSFRSTTQGRIPEEIASQNEVKKALWLAVESLPDKHRIPIILRFGHNLPIKEIADILEIREGTVHSRLHYAQKQLARILDLDVESVLLLQGGQL